MIYYRATSWGSIESKDIARVTDSFVVFPDGRKEKMSTDWQSYFTDRITAVRWIKDRMKKEIENAEFAANLARQKLADFESSEYGKFLYV